MTKFKFLGAAVVISSAFAGPAMAQYVGSQPGYYARSSYCLDREPGNPYSPARDYQAWSAWRSEGGWDSRRDCGYVGPRAYRRLGLGF
jgi:hypothetical protein